MCVSEWRLRRSCVHDCTRGNETKSKQSSCIEESHLWSISSIFSLVVEAVCYSPKAWFSTEPMGPSCVFTVGFHVDDFLVTGNLDEQETAFWELSKFFAQKFFTLRDEGEVTSYLGISYSKGVAICSFKCRLTWMNYSTTSS